MKPKNLADKAVGPPIRRAAPVASWAAEKSSLVKAAGRTAPPGTDVRVAFGFAPMSLKGAAYRWRGLGGGKEDASEPLTRDERQSEKS